MNGLIDFLNQVEERVVVRGIRDRFLLTICQIGTRKGN